MTEVGVSRFVVERVLGHSDKGVTAVYDRNAYRDAKRLALIRLAIFAANGSQRIDLKADSNGD